MNVLLIGDGGREHALAWRLSQSKLVDRLFCWPGNPGTATCAKAENVGTNATDLDGVEKFAKTNAIGLVVIGPEDPLAMGLTDRLVVAGIKTFGPSKEAAKLEGDKWFAKELMRHQAVPTAEARVFTDSKAAEEFVLVRNGPCVVKAAGLAKGKGVTVCYRAEDAVTAIHRAMNYGDFGKAGERVVIEEMLRGPECSVLAFVDKRNIYVMEPAQDHKTIDEGDTGPMTGGMGAYSPTPDMTADMLASLERSVFIPVLDGLRRDGIDYTGVLYAGLMLTASGPKVLEFNCRFGDPETQPLMMRLQSDLAEVMLAVADGKLDTVDLKWDSRPSLGVVAASRGYPGKYTTSVPITGIEAADALPDVKVFHSGTKTNGDQLLTAGGRVLTVTALGDTIADAQKRAYEGLDQIHFDGLTARRDIGWRAVHA